jgi:hypothetical protein
VTLHNPAEGFQKSATATSGKGSQLAEGLTLFDAMDRFGCVQIGKPEGLVRTCEACYL